MAPGKKGGGAKVTTMKDFEAKWGDRRVDVKEVSRVAGYYPTGSLKLDRRLGGGLPMGRMVEIYGPPGGGKTTLALSVISRVLASGGKAAYFDLERGLDLQSEGILGEDGVSMEALLNEAGETKKEAHKKKRTSWLRRNGVDPEHPNFYVFEVDSAEEMFEMLAAIVAGALFQIAVIDSVPAIMPRKALDGDVGDAQYGSRAKLLAEELPRLTRLYSGNLKTTLIFINQVRENIGAQVKSQKASGGFALDHFMRTKIKVQRVARKETGDDVLTESLCKLEKNVTGAYSTETIIISAQRGVDTLSELLEFGVDFGYVHVSGSWHYFFSEPVDAETYKTASEKKKVKELPGFLTGENSRGAALVYMADNGWADKLYPLAMKTY